MEFASQQGNRPPADDSYRQTFAVTVASYANSYFSQNRNG